MNAAVRAVIAVFFVAVAVTALAMPPQASTPQGNAERGRELYDDAYRCYACHGYAGETGSPRLNPMRLEERAFLTVVRAGRGDGQMPSYAAASTDDLIDIYGYIRSLPSDAPDADSIPLLEEVLSEIGEPD